jgi:hypothetical protein
VLAQFAVLVAVLLGIAALASDLGLIRATQASMQNAADAGALEGARWTSAIDDNPRRQLAKDAIKRTYDLDAKVHVDGAIDEYFVEATGLGAGPVVQTFAAGGIHGAGGLAPASVGQYKPNPQPNSQNAQHGDLVAGVFDDEVDAALEFSDYSRTDFAPVAASASQGARSFLARLRRTHDAQGLDAIPGVSNNGGGVPILFGLGPLTLPNTGAAYDVRRDGVTVRATAIAESRPALHVGARTIQDVAPLSSPVLAPYGYLVIGRQVFGETLQIIPSTFTGYEVGLVTPVIDLAWWLERVESGTHTSTLVLYAFEDGVVRGSSDHEAVENPAPGWVLRVSDQDVVPPSAPNEWYTAVPNGRNSVLEVGRVLRVDPPPANYQNYFFIPPPAPLTPAQLAALPGKQQMRYQVDEPLVAPDDTPPDSPGDLIDRDLVFVAVAVPVDPGLGFESRKRIVGFLTFECVATPVYTPSPSAPNASIDAYIPSHLRLELQLRSDYVFPTGASAVSRNGRAALASETSFAFANDAAVEQFVRDEIDPTVDVDPDGMLDLDVAFKFIARHGPLAPVLVR